MCVFGLISFQLYRSPYNSHVHLKIPALVCMQEVPGYTHITELVFNIGDVAGGCKLLRNRFESKDREWASYTCVLGFHVMGKRDTQKDNV